MVFASVKKQNKTKTYSLKCTDPSLPFILQVHTSEEDLSFIVSQCQASPAKSPISRSQKTKSSVEQKEIMILATRI